MMMNMGGSSGGSMGSMGGSMGSMGGSGGGSMGMMMDPSMMNMGSMGGSNSMAMGQMPMNAYGYPAQAMPSHMQMGYANSGFDFTSIIGVLFNFALNLLSLVLVLALIVGTIVFIKRYLFEGNMNLAGLFAPKTNNGVCACCGQPVQQKVTDQQQSESKKV